MIEKENTIRTETSSNTILIEKEKSGYDCEQGNNTGKSFEDFTHVRMNQDASLPGPAIQIIKTMTIKEILHSMSNSLRRKIIVALEEKRNVLEICNHIDETESSGEQNVRSQLKKLQDIRLIRKEDGKYCRTKLGQIIHDFLILCNDEWLLFSSRVTCSIRFNILDDCRRKESVVLTKLSKKYQVPHSAIHGYLDDFVKAGLFDHVENKDYHINEDGIRFHTLILALITHYANLIVEMILNESGTNKRFILSQEQGLLPFSRIKGLYLEVNDNRIIVIN
ncbi:MAG: hypothetical protein GF411_01165 [Candidatus Lokiarchaeota archaeon]|nr:hypothetical protein [Candidatus Lokiarchaeota archaeon]